MTNRAGAFVPGNPSNVAAFEAWRGKLAGHPVPLARVHTFAPGATALDMTLPDWFLKMWGGSAYRDRMLLSLRLLPKDRSWNLRDGANGAYDAAWHIAARGLSVYGLGRSDARVGWEMNGNGDFTAKLDPGAWLAYVQRIAAALHAECPELRLVFSPSAGWTGFDPLRVWDPKVFAKVGPDTYDHWWLHAGATFADRWHAITRIPVVGGVPVHGGLDFWPQFARSQGKRFVVCESGLWNLGDPQGGGGDDKPYIDAMWTYAETHDAEYVCYTNSDPEDGHHRLDNGQFPKAALRYQQLVAAGA